MLSTKEIDKIEAKRKIWEKREAPKVENLIHREVDKGPFTGIARSIECYNNQSFPNYRIVTLHIEKDRVVGRTYSDPYANFEASSRMDLMNDYSMINLNGKWEDGKAFQK